MKFNPLYYILITFLFLRITPAFHIATKGFKGIGDLGKKAINAFRGKKAGDVATKENISKNNEQSIQNQSPLTQQDDNNILKPELKEEEQSILNKTNILNQENEILKGFENEIKQAEENPLNIDLQKYNNKLLGKEDDELKKERDNLDKNLSQETNNVNKKISDIEKNKLAAFNSNVSKPEEDKLSTVLSLLLAKSPSEQKKILDSQKPEIKSKLSDDIRNNSFTLPAGSDQAQFSNYVTDQIHAGKSPASIMNTINKSATLKKMLGGQSPKDIPGLSNSLENFAKAVDSQRKQNANSQKTRTASGGGGGSESNFKPMSFGDYTKATTQLYNDNFNTSSAPMLNPLDTINNQNFNNQTAKSSPEEMKKITEKGINNLTSGLLITKTTPKTRDTKTIDKIPLKQIFKKDSPKKIEEFNKIKQYFKNKNNPLLKVAKKNENVLNKLTQSEKGKKLATKYNFKQKEKQPTLKNNNKIAIPTNTNPKTSMKAINAAAAA